MSERFKIATLDAAKIIKRLSSENIIQDNDGNFRLIFRYDLFGEDKEIIINQDRYASNALFRQILKTLPPAQDLNNSLVFVDFKEVFKENFPESNKNTPSKEDLLNDTETKLKEIFARGIYLSFDGVNYKKFVAFDKSNSMARACVISFIAEEIKAAVDKRLLLGIDLSGVDVVLSKYYAYRGLYLSAARRVDSFAEDENALDLNEETVIVLPAFRTQIIQDVFTAKRKENFWEPFKEEGAILNLNSFDGEGLISPSYATRINEQLNFRWRAHSFQIRLPFTKGVLHETDFIKFFTEEFNCKRELPVKDIFGIERNLLRAKIILTESMFKCADWIKKWSARPSDPMKYFFEKMRLYDHALWICSTDANLSNTGSVSLNYQFLSTLAITPEDFESFIDEQISLIKNVPQSLSNIFKVALRKGIDAENLDGELNFSDDNISLRDKCLKILSKNDAFLRDPKIRAIVDGTQRDLEKELCLGKFEVQGEVRFLSCDLLEFLLRIAENCELDTENFRKQTLLSESFYMPEQKLSMKPDKYYAFLRSPHLSRNEQCLLRPFFKRGNLYDKYFSHLTGAVMVSCKSSVPAALGGADFDGDLIKVISDKRIVDAIKRGAYVQDGKIFKRALPKNTFSNQVGSVSNLAVKFAKKKYSAAEPDIKYQNKCAECTIIVGLEIDAAKNGVHPPENISRLKESAPKKNSFLEMKKFWDKTMGFYTPYIAEIDEVAFDDGGFALYLSKRDFENKKLGIKASSTIFNICTISRASRPRTLSHRTNFTSSLSLNRIGKPI